MKEIGGYFELENFKGEEYYKDLIAVNNGRNALLYILKAKNIKKIYIPYYLCNSVREMLDLNEYDYEYYHIDSKFMPIMNKKFTGQEYIYIVNYYGQLNDKIIKVLKEKYNNIILDNTQAFFQRPIANIDTIYTCRKFFGVPDGAYVFTSAKFKDILKQDISKNRMTHILGRYEGMASEYYNDFHDNDSSFKNEPLKAMSKLTHNLLNAIDYKRIQQIRDENYFYLDNKLGDINKLSLNKQNGPFSYPFYIENGIKVRKELAKKKIYIPTLWPNVLEDLNENSLEYEYAANILPLPCDQRYNIKDMNYIINIILKFKF